MNVLDGKETETALHALQSCVSSWKKKAAKLGGGGAATSAECVYVGRLIREAERLIQKLERPQAVQP